MVTYKDNEIKIIKCVEKQGGDKLTTLHHQINEVLYGIQNQYILPTTTQRVYDELVTIGKALGEYTPKSYEVKKYNELITKLRIAVKLLKTLEQPQENNPKDVAKKLINYEVHKYIKNKPTTETPTDELIKTLERNKTIYEDAQQYIDYPDTFIRMQGELLNLLQKKYQLVEE